jgi:hypothetical protein
MKDFSQIQKIQYPDQNNFRDYINALEKSFYVRCTQTHEPTPMFSYIHVGGMPCTVYSDRQVANDIMLEMQTAYEMVLEVVPIIGLWDFFALCAGRGLCGVVHDNSIGVTFFNRLTDFDRNLPSLMWMKFPDSKTAIKGFFFSRRGPLETKTGTTVLWSNQVKFDKIINKYLLFGEPARTKLDAHAITVSHGVNLSDNDLIFSHGCTFLGPYVSDTGAIPVFSSYEFAKHFANKMGIITNTRL